MNTELLQRVADHIAEEPKRLAMGDWIQRKGEGSWYTDNTIAHDDYAYACRTYEFAKCGTAACIAGWTVLLSADDPRTVTVRGIESDAAKLLGLSYGYDGSDELPESDRLFYAEQWPEQFFADYEKAETPEAKAKIAVARIEHFIKTKGAE